MDCIRYCTKFLYIHDDRDGDHDDYHDGDHYNYHDGDHLVIMRVIMLVIMLVIMVVIMVAIMVVIISYHIKKTLLKLGKDTVHN